MAIPLNAPSEGLKATLLVQERRETEAPLASGREQLLAVFV
ncbi:hypothetical protein [Noviherbaspirillum galbum]|nr:hypothetical protein [Noviherbaspirillum galbum]